MTKIIFQQKSCTTDFQTVAKLNQEGKFEGRQITCFISQIPEKFLKVALFYLTLLALSGNGLANSSETTLVTTNTTSYQAPLFVDNQKNELPNLKRETSINQAEKSSTQFETAHSLRKAAFEIEAHNGLQAALLFREAGLALSPIDSSSSTYIDGLTPEEFKIDCHQKFLDLYLRYHISQASSAHQSAYEVDLIAASHEEMANVYLENSSQVSIELSSNALRKGGLHAATAAINYQIESQKEGALTTLYQALSNEWAAKAYEALVQSTKELQTADQVCTDMKLNCVENLLHAASLTQNSKQASDHIKDALELLETIELQEVESWGRAGELSHQLVNAQKKLEGSLFGRVYRLAKELLQCEITANPLWENWH